MLREPRQLSRHTFLAYVVAALAVAAAAGLTVIAFPDSEARTMLFFVGALTLAAWHGGLAPGLAATILGGLAYMLITPPVGMLMIGDSRRIALLVYYFFVGVMISVLSGLRLRGHLRYRVEKERLLVTLRSIGDGVISTDLAGRVTFLNAAAEAMTGWKDGEARGKKLEEVFRIINEDTREPRESPVTRVLREGQVVGMANHTVLLAKDGREVPLDDSAAPIRNPEGSMEGVILIFRDASEKKRVEKALRESESRFRMMADQAPVGIWLSDREGNVIWINRRSVETSGGKLEDYVGRKSDERIHSDDVAHVREIFAAALAGRTPFEVEFRVRDAKGRYRWMLTQGNPLHDVNGEFAGYVGTSIDIQERKEFIALRDRQLDAERRAREAAELAGKAKDDFLAMLSHELRTPLTPVLATIRAVEMERDIPEHLRLDMETIRRNAELEARLIDDLLDLTRVSKNKVQLNLEPVDTHEALRSVFEICVSELQAKRQHLEMNLNARRHFVRADAARLQQMFWNLLKNASKFTPEKGTITINTLDTADKMLRVEVTDTGIGIDPADLPRLFNAFEQGNKSITRQFGGLGLGLAITKALTEMHGGRISADSHGKGTGATFAIELPAAETIPEVEPERPTERPPEKARSLKILLVEDHADSARTMARLIEGMGHDVKVAGSVAAGLEMALQGEFDLILSDIGLPDGTGMDLIRHVRLKKETPAIALTGFGMEEDIRRSLDAGFAAHLTKPVNFEKLELLIHQTAHNGHRGNGDGK